MADLVNDGALLRNQEQQQKAERFEHLSHSNVSEEVRGPREKLPEHRVICSYPCDGSLRAAPAGGGSAPHVKKTRRRSAGSVDFTQ
jgi:hypothetical protein